MYILNVDTPAHLDMSASSVPAGRAQPTPCRATPGHSPAMPPVHRSRLAACQQINIPATKPCKDATPYREQLPPLLCHILSLKHHITSIARRSSLPKQPAKLQTWRPATQTQRVILCRPRGCCIHCPSWGTLERKHSQQSWAISWRPCWHSSSKAWGFRTHPCQSKAGCARGGLGGGRREVSEGKAFSDVCERYQGGVGH